MTTQTFHPDLGKISKWHYVLKLFVHLEYICIASHCDSLLLFIFK